MDDYGHGHVILVGTLGTLLTMCSATVHHQRNHSSQSDERHFSKHTGQKHALHKCADDLKYTHHFFINNKQLGVSDDNKKEI